YTCGDTFHQSSLLDHAEEGLLAIADAAREKRIVVVAGVPLRREGRLYNCAVSMASGKVVGVVPKSYLPNYREYYEQRWFSGGAGESGTICVGGSDVPFGDRLVFASGKFFRFGIEVCEDLWNLLPPSSLHAAAGATVIVNPSASNELVTKSTYRKALVTGQSARCIAAYVYCSSGVNESTTDTVFGGHQIIAENGAMLSENTRFQRGPCLTFADVDCERLFHTRLCESVHNGTKVSRYRTVRLPKNLNEVTGVERVFDPHPFVPANFADRNANCEEIFNIQKNGLSTRLERSGAATAVVGVSGGIDSTLALLVAVEAFRSIGRDVGAVIGVTMPGFGTSDRTKGNAEGLCRALGIDFRQIPIAKACEVHFSDIGQDPGVHDVTYENVQARERTQILMDMANKENGLVVGTGDLSEAALGWCTYNGDHMSMYAVNCGVPKTLVRYVIQWFAEGSAAGLRGIIEDIIATPVSPELLPASDDGDMSQQTEQILGPYELHDFFLYHTIKYGASPEKILYMAEKAFDGKYGKEKILETLTIFVKRFFASQFKRSCVPDGPKVGTIALSPRADWRMPSDASPDTWLKKLKTLNNR
ncbi:MAG: NAD(+) synthase, partial [Victivallales bacterium]|nr:NAD(+) synthase [Victivallales bacterium]